MIAIINVPWWTLDSVGLGLQFESNSKQLANAINFIILKYDIFLTVQTPWMFYAIFKLPSTNPG